MCEAGLLHKGMMGGHDYLQALVMLEDARFSANIVQMAANGKNHPIQDC